MISQEYLAWWISLSAIGLLGCPNTGGEFEAFQDRYEAIHDDGDGGGGAGGGASCMGLPAPGSADGPFLFAFSASLDPKSPVLFDTDLTTAMGSAGLEFSLTFQALDAKDRKTPVGAPLDLGPFAVNADGTFSADFPPLDVAGAANPLSGSDITADVLLTGTLCDPVDFVCGSLSGNVTKPAEIDLKNSTFAMERLDAPGMYPAAPKINCKGDTAKPL